ncbi:MAG: delta-60 repeat domain-containing protein [Coxiellaceae bacterium]|nr:delta-60 repeat domain-containing protein [Coxiellaceae bacterium]
MKKILYSSTLLLTLHSGIGLAVLTANVSGFPDALAVRGVGGVYAAVKDKETNALYLSGSFTGIGVDSGAGAMFTANGSPVNKHVKYNGHVSSSLPDMHGGFYVAGAFTSIGGDKDAKYLAHINADGSVDTSFKPHMPEKIYQIKLIGHKLYAESSKYRTIYQVNTDSGELNANFHVNTNLPITSMVATHHGLYIGGSFHRVNNQSKGYFAKLDLETGRVIKDYYKSNKKVKNIAASSDDKLYINTKDGELIKIDEVSGVKDQTFGALVGSPLKVAIDQDWVWATYRFSPFVKRFSVFDGSADASLQSPLNSMVRDIAFDDHFAYFAGDFTHVSGHAGINRIARFNKNTLTVDSSFHPMIAGGAAATVSISRDKVFTGGYFNTAYGTAQPYLIKVDATTGKPDLSFRPVLDNYPYAMAIHGDDLYIGGAFSVVDGVSQPKMAKISKKTGHILPAAFAMKPNWPIYTMKTHGDYLYVGGMFNNIAGSGDTPYLARFNIVDGAYDGHFRLSGLNNRVFAIDFDDSSIYVGGKFSDRLSKYDVITGEKDLSFRPFTYASQISGVVVYNNAVYASVNRSDGIEKFNKVTGEKNANTPHLNHYGRGLAKQNNLLLISSYGAVTCVDMDADSVVPQLTFSTNQLVNQVTPFDGSGFFIAGQYTVVNNQSIKYLTKVSYNDQ